MDDVRIISPRVPFTVVKDRNNGHLSREGYTFLRDALNGLSNRINFLEMQLAQEASVLPLLAETVKAGTYVPTLFHTVDVSAATAYTCQYVKLQRVVLVSGRVDIQPTAAGGAITLLGMSIPIPSTFSAAEMLGGTAACNTVNQSIATHGDTVNNRATFSFASASTVNMPFFFTFAYQIR